MIVLKKCSNPSLLRRLVMLGGRQAKSPARVGFFLILLFLLSLPAVTQESIQVGYGVLTSGPDGHLPVASALYSVRNSSGMLVSEAGVAAVRPVRAGRIFVDQNGTQTGLALVNPSPDEESVGLMIRDTLGAPVAQTQITLTGHEHRAKFVDELFPDLPAGFVGTLTFTTLSANTEVAAVTLRLTVNQFQEPLLATLPVAELDPGEAAAAGLENSKLIFPHIGAGAGTLSTQIVLINRTSTIVRGQIEFRGPDGSPLSVDLEGVSGSVFPYELSANGSFRSTVTKASGVVQGYALVSVESGDRLPAGTAIFQFRGESGQLWSEAGVGATPPTSRARVFVDNAGTQTGVALAGLAAESTRVDFDLLDRQGFLIATTSRDLPAQGKMAVFVDELFPDLEDGFTGLMEIRADRPIAPITLKLSVNARNNLIVTTLPVADLTLANDGEVVIFPQVGFGMGFATRLILMNPLVDQTISGSLEFRQSDGSALMLPLGSESGSRFDFSLPKGGGRQLHPGNTAQPAAIVVYPISGGLEVVVNQGNTLSLNSIVIDNAGEYRDDFGLEYSSLSPEVASVDPMGRINGNSIGFSSLTVTSGDVVQTATISVVGTGLGSQGFAARGVSRDLAGRTYLAGSQSHTVLLSSVPNQPPEVYAGMVDMPGLRNGERQQSLFNKPIFLAFNQADGSDYVSDQENNAIRRIGPGRLGRVETIAGSLEPGSADGSPAQARFNRPSGVALDYRGNLWIADSGNHTIRRINFATEEVETVAGLAGAPGSQDGLASQARFNSPRGLAIEPEPLETQLAREQRGDPPPPVSLLVADRNNGAIRRVREDGTVTTLTAPVAAGQHSPSQSLPLRFETPAGVAADSLGRIYVSEPEMNRVSVLLSTGELVPVVQPGTLHTPVGIAVTDSREVAIGVDDKALVNISYGQPEILQSPVSEGDRFVVRGRNFSRDTTILIPGVDVEDVQVEDTSTLSFSLGPVPSVQDSLLTVLSRAGVLQRPVRVFTDRTLGDPVGGLANFSPQAVALDLSGDILVSIGTDPSSVFRIRSTTGTTTRVAGESSGNGGDGGPAQEAHLNGPSGLAADRRGNFYIADNGNHQIRRVDAGGIITTVVGTGSPGFSGDGGPALQAQLNRPRGVAVGPSGNLYIADTQNHRIRRLDAESGLITSIAGNGVDQFSGDNGPALEASLSSPTAVAVDSLGNLLIADQGNNRIRQVAPGSGIITTVAGNGQAGFSGDGGPATSAQLNFPRHLTLDIDGNLYIADTFNNRIRRVDALTGTITTVAGNGGNTDHRQDGVPATSFPLFSTIGVAVDAGGNLVILENSSFSTSFQVVRVNALTEIATTILVEPLLVN